MAEAPNAVSPLAGDEQCHCSAGYSCSTPGRMSGCDLDLMECIAEHYHHDCGHSWNGEGIEGETPGGGWYSSQTCSKCGVSSIRHDMMVGP